MRTLVGLAIAATIAGCSAAPAVPTPTVSASATSRHTDTDRVVRNIRANWPATAAGRSDRAIADDVESTVADIRGGQDTWSAIADRVADRFGPSADGPGILSLIHSQLTPDVSFG